ncbi:MAG TPA: methyltransferase domain-containing protein [Anaeromyxobacter sp.]
MPITRRVAAVLLLATVSAVSTGCAGWAAAAEPQLDVPYEPTPPEVVRAMLQLAAVAPGDTVYDLGCGDGRIVIEAAKLGARGVGVDLDPQRIREGRANARAAGVEDAVELRVGDLFAADVRPATVVMLFLWPEVNLRLRPKLLAELRPGARVVSHWHDMGDWKPEKTIQVSGRKVYLWIIPERGGRTR